jgi:CheY-like chemotaxis protein
VGRRGIAAGGHCVRLGDDGTAGTTVIDEAPRGGTLYILVVDDEVEVANLLQEVLQSRGHHVATARDGQVALDRVGERTYDLILCDVNMPVLDGPGLYGEIERLHPGIERRIVFMAGDNLSVDARQFLERSGMPILSKPFDQADVMRAINRAATHASSRPA